MTENQQMLSIHTCNAPKTLGIASLQSRAQSTRYEQESLSPVNNLVLGVRLYFLGNAM